MFTVGVRLALRNEVSTGLLAISRDLLRTQGHVDGLIGRLRTIGTLAIGGAVGVGLGMKGFEAMKGPLEEAIRYQQRLAKFGTFGLGAAANAEADRFAQSMNIMGSTYTDNMNRMIEAQGVFRESGKRTLQEQLEGAKLAAPLLGKIEFAQRAMNPDQAENMHAQNLAMLRFIETRGGVTDPKVFNAIADAGFKAIQSSGGNINWEQLRAFMATGGIAAQGVSDTALFGKLEPIIGELKGQRAGTALMTAFNRLEGITRLPNQVAQELVKMGVWDGSKITWNSMGGIKSMNGNPLIQDAMFRRDPVEFYEKVILPMYQRMGLADANARQRENALIFGRTGGAMFSLIDRQLPAIHNSVLAQQRAMGIDAAYNAAGETAAGKLLELQAERLKLEKSLGDTILPLYVEGLRALIPLLQSVTTFTREHKTATQALVGVFLAGSTLLVAAGAFALLGAGITGFTTAAAFIGPLIAPALGALGGGITALAGGISAPVLLIVGAATAIGLAVWNIWKSWDTNKNVFDNILTGLKNFFGGIGDLIKANIGWLKFMPGGQALWAVEASMGKGVGGIKAVPGPAPWGNFDLSSIMPDWLHYTAPGQKPWKPPEKGPGVNWFGRERQPGDPGYVPPQRQKTPYVPTPKAEKMSLKGDMIVDGHKLGRWVNNYQADEDDRAARSMGGFDGEMSLQPVGLSNA